MSGLVGAVFFAMGTYSVRHDVFNEQSVRVYVSVIANHGGSGDGSYAPEFEIVGGPYAGRRWASNHYSGPPVHQVGDKTMGLFDPGSGRIVSDKSLQRDRFMDVLISFIGAGLLAFAGLMVFFGRPHSD